jgi:[ribosomal protein S18]-alanine N-acetyltransferase
MRLACAADADALAAIHHEAFPVREAWGADAIALQIGLPGGFGLIDAGDGMILARIVGDDAEVLTLAVVPSRRRRGVGRALLVGVLEEARRRGARAVFLEVSETNEAARALYATAGFAEMGRRRRYYANGTDALVLRATFSPSSVPEC